MDTTSSETLFSLAKTQLGLLPSAPNTAVPPFYLDELKRHFLLYPHDSNFLVTLEPQCSFGKVICLEDGCDRVSIQLIRRLTLYDGGRRDGFGSLSAYQYHIAQHPTHVKSRHVRIKAEIAVKKNEVFVAASSSTSASTEIETSSLISILDSGSLIGASSVVTHAPAAPVCGSGLAAGLSQPSRRISSLERIKPEAVEPAIPRKRDLETALVSGIQDQGGEARQLQPKKFLKTEPTLKVPLTMVDKNTGSSEHALVQAPPTSFVADIREKLAAVQNSISSLENGLDRFSHKYNKTKADLTKIDNQTRELQHLRRLKTEYNASLPAMLAPGRTLSKPVFNLPVNPEIATSTIPPTYHSGLDREPAPWQQIASSSNIRLPLIREHVDMDIDDDDVGISAAVMQRIGNIIPELPPIHGTDVNDVIHGRDLFVGPQAKADDIDKFLLEAGNAEQFDGNARLDKALEKLGLQSQYDLLPGMEVALMPHQTIGVAWMTDKEQSSLKGGCLGDDMGLGKTVQMIAVLIKNRSKDPRCKTNLIIAPTALLDQWKFEIEMKTNCGLKCLVYHGSSKPKRKHELLKFDVVLTTYSTMALEWPDLEAEQKKKLKAKRQRPAHNFIASDSDCDPDDLKPRKRKKQSGLLFQVDFYRIILDEAQSIRNRRTRASRAVTDLQTDYRWCLTGTPIINGLADVYGYLRFLKIRPWYDFTEFQGHIGSLEKKNPSLAVSRLQAVITTFLLRRMKDSMLDGKRLIELPDKTVLLVKLEFSEEERAIYKMVEARTQASFNRYLRAGTVLKNYSQVLVLLLRLRQICSHPSLIQEDGSAFTSPEYNEELMPQLATELTRAQRLVSLEFVTKMTRKFKESALQRIEAEKESADAVVEDEECPICFDILTDAVITPCTHIFCRECLIDVLNTPLIHTLREPATWKPNERPCPACRSPICSEKIFSRAPFLPSDIDLLPDNEEISQVGNSYVETAGPTITVKNTPEKTKTKKRRRVTHRLATDSDNPEAGAEPESDFNDREMSEFIVQNEEEQGPCRKLKERLGKRKATVIDSDDEAEKYFEDKERLSGAKIVPHSTEGIRSMPRFLPSTKMKYMMDHLRKLEEHPDEKTLIISQWTGCLSLVSDYLAEAGIVHVKYQGDMNRAKRDQAVRVFMSKNNARIMLMSLKCGGVGLNLTRANNVISLDLGWSRAVEAQSFDRVHRLGQTRPVVVQRLVISDTVEDRVLAMQERKQTLADGSLGEGTGKKIGRLSVKELANLFGLDHRGRLLAKN